MRQLGGALWRLAIFVAVCVLGAFALFAVFAQLRFQSDKTLQGRVHQRVRACRADNFVRIAGVEVGKVKNISIQPDSTVLVEFSADPTRWCSPRAPGPSIRYDNLIGGRYLALEEGAGGVKQLNPGDTIPLARPSRRWTSTR